MCLYSNLILLLKKYAQMSLENLEIQVQQKAIVIDNYYNINFLFSCYQLSPIIFAAITLRISK